MVNCLIFYHRLPSYHLVYRVILVSPLLLSRAFPVSTSNSLACKHSRNSQVATKRKGHVGFGSRCVLVIMRISTSKTSRRQTSYDYRVAALQHKDYTWPPTTFIKYILNNILNRNATATTTTLNLSV